MEIFNLTLNEATYSTITVQNIAIFPGIFISNFLLSKFSFRKVMIIECSLTLAGIMLRLLWRVDLLFLIIGQGIIGLGSPFYNSIPIKLSAIWFPQHERTYSTNFFLALNQVGFGLGAYVPQFFVNTESTDPDQTIP